MAACGGLKKKHSHTLLWWALTTGDGTVAVNNWRRPLRCGEEAKVSSIHVSPSRSRRREEQQRAPGVAGVDTHAHWPTHGVRVVYNMMEIDRPVQVLEKKIPDILMSGEKRSGEGERGKSNFLSFGQRTKRTQLHTETCFRIVPLMGFCSGQNFQD